MANPTQTTQGTHQLSKRIGCTKPYQIGDFKVEPIQAVPTDLHQLDNSEFPNPTDSRFEVVKTGDFQECEDEMSNLVSGASKGTLKYVPKLSIAKPTQHTHQLSKRIGSTAPYQIGDFKVDPIQTVPEDLQELDNSEFPDLTDSRFEVVITGDFKKCEDRMSKLLSGAGK